MTRRWRRGLRPLASLGLRLAGAWRARSYDVGRTVVLACQARGGSTWLAETLATMDGAIHLNEPLHRVTAPRCQRFGFDWYTRVAPGDDAPAAEAYLDEVLHGRRLEVGLVATAHLRLSQLMVFRRYVVKFCRANLLLGWMADRFPVKVVVLLRHPCAVVASRLRFGERHGIGEWVDPARWPTALPARLVEERPQLLELQAGLSGAEEHQAFWWALNTLLPLEESVGRPWVVTTYEWLVRGWHGELQRIFTALDEPLPSAAAARHGVDSISTLGARGGDPLARWRRELTADQIARILGVVERMGVEVYDDGLEPRRSTLP